MPQHHRSLNGNDQMKSNCVGPWCRWVSRQSQQVSHFHQISLHPQSPSVGKIMIHLHIYLLTTMHATIFGQISPEFPFVNLGGQTQTESIFNEAVSGGHFSCSPSSSSTTTLCCRLVTISACRWWSEKNNQMSIFPRRKPSDECFCPFAYAARCCSPPYVSSAGPIYCLRHVQQAIYPQTPHLNCMNVSCIYAHCLFLSNLPAMMKQFLTELTSVRTF